ncbi:MAG: glycine betaine ABC transporter substrate-binding protein [Solirubrobacteraceae bacterium]
MRRTLALLAALAAVAVLAACGGGDDETTTTGARTAPPAGPPIRIGVKNFTEQAILGELYRQALEAKGYDVVLKPNIGSTELIHRALRRGSLDMYPEYVGVLLSEVAEVRARPRDATAAYALAKAYEMKGGFTLLAQTPFSDANAIGVKPAFAGRHRVRSIADLRRVRRNVRIGAPPEFRTRFEGLEGLREVYGLRNLRVSPMPAERRYSALDNGAVDAAVVFTTDSQLADGKYVVLRDQRRLFASGHVAPIISEQTLEAHGPGLRTAIDAVTRALTTSMMRDMNAAVDLENRKPVEVARAYLRSKGLD